MKFFIPSINSEDSENLYKESFIKFIEEQGYKPLKEKRVYSLTFEYNGKFLTETIGEISPSNNEPIFIIFETINQFLTCTTKRGIIGGEPMIISKQNIIDIEYFETYGKDVFEYNEWCYKLINKEPKVNFPNELPSSLYKYYVNNSDNKNAIIERYLFCSHPYHLNDSMDCNPSLWDFTKISKKGYDGFFEYYKNSSYIKKEVEYLEDKKNKFENLKTSFWNYITKSFGIISLSENPLHTLMWSHYSTEKGFMIELDRELLLKEPKKKNAHINRFNFTPIQYVEKLEKINFFSKNFTTPDVPLLYFLNVKRKDWDYENEWRIVPFADNFGIPNSIINSKPDDIGTDIRKFYYNKNVVKSLTFGKFFFKNSNFVELDKNNSDIEFINYLYENLNDELYISDEFEESEIFKRSRRKIKLEKVSKNKFKITEASR